MPERITLNFRRRNREWDEPSAQIVDVVPERLNPFLIDGIGVLLFLQREEGILVEVESAVPLRVSKDEESLGTTTNPRFYLTEGRCAYILFNPKNDAYIELSRIV